VDARCESPAEAAAAIATHFRLGLSGGLVVANPIPAEFELAADVHDAALVMALADASAAGVRSRAVTPFLLERMRVLTGDASLAANEALLAHNARTAALIATQLVASDP
jgi:pseudouridine-5'-phosphate glycosidase